MTIDRFLIGLVYLGVIVLGFFQFRTAVTFLEYLQVIFGMVFILATTLLAQQAWQRAADRLARPGWQLKTIGYLPLVYLVFIVFELGNNLSHLGQPGFVRERILGFLEGLGWQFGLLVLASWIAFQTLSIGRAMSMVLVLAVLFDWLFVSRSPVSLAYGFLWLWLLASTWVLWASRVATDRSPLATRRRR